MVIIAKQIVRGKLRFFDLPKAYRVLGRHGHAAGQFRDDFPRLYAKIDDRLHRIEELNSRPESGGPAETISGRLRRWATACKNTAQATALRCSVADLMGSLGQVVYRRHGKQAEPPEVVDSVEAILGQDQELRGEIAKISATGQGRIITPTRLAVAMVVGVAILAVAMPSRLYRNRPASSNAHVATQRSNANAGRSAISPPGKLPEAVELSGRGTSSTASSNTVEDRQTDASQNNTKSDGTPASATATTAVNAGPPKAGSESAGIAEDTTASFLGDFLDEENARRYIGQRIIVTGHCITYVVDNPTEMKGGEDYQRAVGGGSLGLGVVFEFPNGDELAASCYFQADKWKSKELPKDYSTPVTVAGTLKDIRYNAARAGDDVSHCIVLADCDIEQTTPAGAGKHTSAQPLIPPPGSRELSTTVRTVGIGPTDWVVQKHNASLAALKCYATSDQLIIDFDVDTSNWVPVNKPFPLLVRLFDRNGEHLTHFTTVEGFTAISEVRKTYERIRERFTKGGSPDEAAKYKCVLLKPKGNRFVYGVNVRDLRDVSMAEVGFMKR